ncbi:MCP four helix bundle domain-containing protein [Limnohabitans sp. JUR4]|uniref:MCP four helix bundle domain-containing protein n=1 Tax=Limnohabitans radicicola TaxID=2771427 RepID=A0A927FI40_9BURK|nr:methyl-accepting chemotaxis protein [Limnohabitans radicicola]MBD8050458.1 MCP four helix bundle domain-containing protein [Limnohabitans radicicola]
MKNLNVAKRLMLLVLLLGLLSVSIGINGLMNLADSVKSMQTVYDDRVVPLRDLKVIADMYAVNIVDTSHKVRNSNISWEEGRKNLADAEQQIAEKWNKYKNTVLVPEEQRLVAEIEPMFKSTQVELDRMRDILTREDRHAMAEFTAGPLYPAIDPISGKFSDLIEVQLKVAKQEYEDSIDRYESNRIFSIGLIVLGLALGAAFALWIVRSVSGPLEKVRKMVHEVAKSADFSKRVKVESNDEVGQTAKAFNALMDSQQTAIQEVNRTVTAMAQGNFSLRVTAQLEGDLKTMKDAINTSVESIQLTIQDIGQMLNALSNGNFSARSSAQVQGEFKQALDQTITAMASLESMIGDVGQVMSHVARGDLSQRVVAEGHGDLITLKDNINSSLDAMSQALRAIHGNTRQVATAANETSNAIAQISDGAQNQTHAISQVAAAVRQTATSVSDVSRNTSIASQKSHESIAIIRDGMQKMSDMVNVVSNIATNSDKINKITEVIEKIANKTNLLSLNAAIEAARAGEHGKGFSVVAEEVGKLAANSAESSQEIAQLVQQAVTETAKAVATVKEVSEDMSRIELASRETDQMLQRISAALEQQSSATEEINANVFNLDRIASSNASAAEEITASVMELSKIADGTRRELEKFSMTD